MISLTRLSLYATLLVLMSAFAVPSAAIALDLDGKRVEIIVPFGEGGGTDTYARFLAPRWHANLPGKSTLVIRNIRGAGSIAGANQFESRAKPNGLTLLAVSTSTLLNYVLKDPRVTYDPTKWIPLIVSPLGNVSYVHTKTGVTTPGATVATIKTLQKAGLVMGANGPTSADLVNLVSLDMIGIPVKPVFGLNRGKSRQALERGEFTLSFDNTAGYRKHVIPLVKSGIAVPIMTRGYLDAKGDIVTDPGNPDLPSFDDAYKMLHGKAPSGPQYEAYKTLVYTSVMTSKALIVPAGTPKDIVDAYRKAMKDLVTSATFAKESERFLGGYPSLLEDQAERALLAATRMDPDVRGWLFTWLKKKYDVKR